MVCTTARAPFTVTAKAVVLGEVGVEGSEAAEGLEGVVEDVAEPLGETDDGAV